MAKTVGFLCALKPEWMNKTVELVLDHVPTEDIKDTLNDYVSYDIQSPDNIKKTRIALMNLWVRPFEDDRNNWIREYALKAIEAGNADRAAMHWCMLLLNYGVFSDVAGAIGKISTMQDEFSSTWLRRNILEQWGERGTVLRSVSMVLQTMRQLGVINTCSNIHTVNRQKITNSQTVIVLMKTALAINTKPYYEPSELASIAQLFPFNYEATSEIIFGSHVFEFGNFGGSPVIVS